MECGVYRNDGKRRIKSRRNTQRGESCFVCVALHVKHAKRHKEPKSYKCAVISKAKYPCFFFSFFLSLPPGTGNRGPHRLGNNHLSESRSRLVAAAAVYNISRSVHGHPPCLSPLQTQIPKKNTQGSIQPVGGEMGEVGVGDWGGRGLLLSHMLSRADAAISI